MINKPNRDISEILKLFSAQNQSKETVAKQMINSLSSDESQKLNEILSDKAKLEQLMNSPAAKELINKLNRNQNG